MVSVKKFHPGCSLIGHYSATAGMSANLAPNIYNARTSFAYQRRNDLSSNHRGTSRSQSRVTERSRNTRARCTFPTSGTFVANASPTWSRRSVSIDPLSPRRQSANGVQGSPEVMKLLDFPISKTGISYERIIRVRCCLVHRGLDSWGTYRIERLNYSWFARRTSHIEAATRLPVSSRGMCHDR